MLPMSPELEKEVRGLIKLYLDFPVPKVGFLDIGPLLRSPALRKTVVHYMADGIIRDCYHSSPDLLAVIESRGFLLGEAVADILNIGVVMIRKEGKLPGKVIQEVYSTEYKARNVAEIQTESILPGERVVLFDDVLATGGTFRAAHKLVSRLGGKVIGAAALASIESIPVVFDPQQENMQACGLRPWRLLGY